MFDMETTQKYFEVTDGSFLQEVLLADKPVLVEFGAEWCGPCKVMLPTINELAGEYEGKACFAKLDVDQNAQMTVKFGVRNLPTMLLFKDGEVVEKIIGAVPKKTLAEKLAAHM